MTARLEPRKQIAEYSDRTGCLKIEIPMTPMSLNTMYSFYKGRKLLTKSGRRWRDSIDPFLASIKVSYRERVRVWMEVWPKTTRAYDLDNCAKPILDALQRNSILENDELVYSLHMEKHDKNTRRFAGGTIWVDIWPYEGDITQNYSL